MTDQPVIQLRRIAEKLGRIEGDLDRIVQMLNIGEAELDVSFASLIDHRTAQAVVALNEILEEVRSDRRDELIESILDEAVEEGLLEPEAGLPGEWEEPPEEQCSAPIPPSEVDQEKWRGMRCERVEAHEGKHRATYGSGPNLAVREWSDPASEGPGQSAYKQVKTELETFLRGREVDIENPAGHHRGELREYSAEKLAMALTDKLVGMKLE